MTGEPRQRILVIRLSSLGDILLTTPVLRLLRRAYPEAQIEVLVKAEYKELLQAHPAINAVHLWQPGQTPRQLLHHLRQTRYDVVLDLHRTLRSRLLLLSLRARQKLAYNKQTLRRALLVLSGWNTLQAPTSVPERYAVPLRRLGITAPLTGLEMHLTLSSRDTIVAYLRQELGQHVQRPLLGLAPGARWPTKRWPVERFAAVAQYVGQTQGAAIVLLGGTEDVPLAQAVCQHLNVPVLNTTGQLSLMHTAALLQHCRVLLCNDSGLMHMAVALGVPVVAMFGPTVEAFGFYPFQAQARVLSTSLACRPCTTKGTRLCPQGHHGCMQQLTTAQVLQAVRHVWAGDVV